MALPGAVFTIYLFVRRYSFGQVVKSLIVVFLPVLLLAASWYVLAFVTGRDAFTEKVYYENIARFTSTMDDEPHKHGIGYLFGTLLLGFLPWTLILLSVAFARAKSWRVAVRNFSSWTPLTQFFAISALVITLFFCVPSSKRSVYLLPAYPFFALFIARGVASISEIGRIALRISSGFVVLVALLVVVALAILAWTPFSIGSLDRASADLVPYYKASLTPVNTLLLILSLGAVIWSTRLVTKAREDFSVVLLAVVVAVSSLVALYNRPVGAAIAEGLSPKTFAKEIVERVPAANKVYSYKNEFYAVSFYAKRRIDRFSEAVRTGDYVLSYEKDLESLRAQYSIEVVSTSDRAIVKKGQRLALVKVL